MHATRPQVLAIFTSTAISLGAWVGTCSAQYVDFPDIVIPSDGSLAFHFDDDRTGTPDLVFHGFSWDIGGPPTFLVETGYSELRVVGTFEPLMYHAPATALPPGVFVNSFEAPFSMEPVALAHVPPDGPCEGGWCTPGIRFLGLRYNIGLGLAAGWIRIKSEFDADGGLVITLLDMQLPSVETVKEVGVWVPTLIDGFYLEQACTDGADSVTVWMGGVWPQNCGATGIAMSVDGTTIDFTAVQPTSSGPWGSCDFAETSWIAMKQLPQGDDALPLGTYELTSTIVFTNQQPMVTDRGSIVLDCGNADLNGDGVVDGADLGILLNNWGGDGVGDLNGDGVVDGADLGILLINWG